MSAARAYPVGLPKGVDARVVCRESLRGLDALPDRDVFEARCAFAVDRAVLAARRAREREHSLFQAPASLREAA